LELKNPGIDPLRVFDYMGYKYLCNRLLYLIIVFHSTNHLRNAGIIPVKTKFLYSNIPLYFPRLITMILGFAIFMDIIDWLGIGSIPLLGDIFDLFAGAVTYFWVKIRGLDKKKPWFISWMSGGATLIELIPGGDLLPSYTLAVILIMIFNTSWGRRGAKILSPI